MKIAPAAAGLAPAAMTPAYARETATRLSPPKAAAALKAEIVREAVEARLSPLFDAQESRKSQAKARLQQIREWVKIVRKLYAQNPEGMAKTLAQAFKDLKAAVQAYREAGGEEMAAAGGMAPPVAPAPVQAPREPGASDPAEAADETEDARAPDQDAPPEGAADDEETAGDGSGNAPFEEPTYGAFGHGLYDAVVGEVKRMIGEDGLDFLKQVRGLVNDLRDLLQTARGQAAIRKRDARTETALKDADEALKALNRDMGEMDQQIRRDAPTVSLGVSVAA
ncbi:MAG: hypothetical protein K1X35_06115 [Caulobacteraceae bacterium]|nr:hypothetical protein [Caulobacteraceae bacterium]